MPESESQAKILQIALELADTGPFRNYQEIEDLLRTTSQADALGVFKDPATRKLLNERCQATIARLQR